MARGLKWIERCLWAAGLLALGACALVWLHARFQQARGNLELDRRIRLQTSSTPATSAPTPAPPKPATAHGSLVGRLEIPRLKISAVVFEGTDSPVLERGVGHLAGSPLPGENGNVVMAAHRDTFFRPLRNIRANDEIIVTTEQGARRYEVESTKVINPDEAGVLDDTPDPTLTLVTCYPFRYVGHAPQRFIVRSREISNVTMVASQSTTQPVISESKPVPVKARPVRARRATAVKATAKHEPPPGSKRGLKKLNPIRLFAKLAHPHRRSAQSATQAP